MHQTARKFLKKMLDAIDYEVGEHMDEYPADEEVEKRWNLIQESLIYTPLTKTASKLEKNLERL